MPFADAMFLTPETRDQPMHVGGLQLFRYPEGAGDDWLRDVRARLLGETGVAPLFRRRPERVALGAWWRWVDDDDVDLGYHVRHSALPRPGRTRELLELVSRLHGNLLDRSRPLWEAHLVEGLDGDRFAVYTKLHHALLDGVSALRLLQRSMSASPDDPTPVPWAPQPPAPPRHGGRGGSPLDALRSLAGAATLGPRLAYTAAEALRRQAVLLPAGAPRSMLNVGVSGARRYAAQSWPLDEVRRIGHEHGATINDVVLAMCGGALRAYMADLGQLPAASLVAMTPVSLRRDGDDDRGNLTGAVLCPIGTDTADPVARLVAVRDWMTRTKELLSGLSQTEATALGALVLAPMLLQVPGAGRRLAAPAYNLVISNLPGPAERLFWNGAELQGLYPLSIPLAGQALNITVTSYAGSLDVGLTGDRRAVPHLQRLLGHLDDALAGLAR
ncbi:MAG TPA: wax ester/triacylglycerol synthase family O-acyltransferase [Acidimicrobiales bacterium]|nr:wax ester/triacylglycerol synthase family O-acyltransferase [Acidimicrobiales bacterium]